MTGRPKAAENRKHNTKACEGCAYRARHPALGKGFFCNYLQITGKSRVGQGFHLLPGGGCGAKNRKADIAEHAAILIAAEEDGKKTKGYYRQRAERILRLYRTGMTDTEIAAEIGCTRKVVKNTRNKMKLPSNYRRPRAGEEAEE